MKKTLPVGGIKYGIRWVMLQIGSCCNNHLIINVIFKRLGVKAGKDIKLEVGYKADNPEYFDKTITVFCNAKFSPIQLRITGNAR